MAEGAVDALQEAEHWIVAFLRRGGAEAGKPSSATTSTSSASATDATLHAEAGSDLVVRVLEEALKAGGLTQGSFLPLPHVRMLLRLARVPALAEAHRLRREWLACLALQGQEAAQGPADLAAAVKAFALHVNAALRQ